MSTGGSFSEGFDFDSSSSDLSTLFSQDLTAAEDEKEEELSQLTLNELEQNVEEVEEEDDEIATVDTDFITLDGYGWPSTNEEIEDVGDFLGVLGDYPIIRSKGENTNEFTMTLFQTCDHRLDITFDCESAEMEPKFQQLIDGPGTIVFIRHIMPYEEGHAVLHPPINIPYKEKPHFRHRTIFAVEANIDQLQSYLKV